MRISPPRPQYGDDRRRDPVGGGEHGVHDGEGDVAGPGEPGDEPGRPRVGGRPEHHRLHVAHRLEGGEHQQEAEAQEEHVQVLGVPARNYKIN